MKGEREREGLVDYPVDDGIQISLHATPPLLVSPFESCRMMKPNQP